MTQEQKARAYDEAVNKIKPLYEQAKRDGNPIWSTYEYLFPELKESENERIRKLLVWQVHRNIEDETNDLAQSVYDGIKGHDPDLEESIEDWKRCLAYLEKQKEQEPVEPSDTELQRHQDELHDFKVFATRQAREHHISFVHDFEWNNFCEGLLSYFNEKQKPAEWSEEDEKLLDFWLDVIDRNDWRMDENFCKASREFINRLKSLRPSWKPSENQMSMLLAVVNDPNNAGSASCHLSLESLYNDLKKL